MHVNIHGNPFAGIFLGSCLALIHPSARAKRRKSIRAPWSTTQRVLGPRSHNRATVASTIQRRTSGVVDDDYADGCPAIMIKCLVGRVANTLLGTGVPPVELPTISIPKQSFFIIKLGCDLNSAFATSLPRYPMTSPLPSRGVRLRTTSFSKN